MERRKLNNYVVFHFFFHFQVWIDFLNTPNEYATEVAKVAEVALLLEQHFTFTIYNPNKTFTMSEHLSNK